MPEEKTENIEKKTKEEAKWVNLKPAEVEKIILDLAKKGETPSKIGIILRDEHGIPSVKSVLNKKIEKILQEKNAEYTSEKEIIESRIESLRKHIEANKKDHTATRALTKKLWALQRQ